MTARTEGYWTYGDTRFLELNELIEHFRHSYADWNSRLDQGFLFLLIDDDVYPLSRPDLEAAMKQWRPSHWVWRTYDWS